MQTPSIVFVPNRQLPSVLDGLAQFNGVQNSPMILIIEDHPFLAPHIHPRQLLFDVGLTAIEPCNAMELEFMGLAAGRLASATKKPIGLIAHHGLLGSAASAVESSNEEVASTRLHGETSDPIRLSRRLELNRQRTLPSPGERGAVGFVTVGLADTYSTLTGFPAPNRESP